MPYQALPFDALPEWAQEMANQAMDQMTAVVKTAALEANAFVVRNTPVDTGTARGNWLASVGTPINFVIPWFAHPKLGSAIRTFQAGRFYEQTVADQLINSNEVVINGFDVRQTNAIFLTNNVKYLDQLNTVPSRSLQTKGEFVERSIAFAQIAAVNAWNSGNLITGKPRFGLLRFIGSP